MKSKNKQKPKLARIIPSEIKQTIIINKAISNGIVSIIIAIAIFFLLFKDVKFKAYRINKNSPKTEGVVYNVMSTKAEADGHLIYAYYYTYISPDGHELEGVSYQTYSYAVNDTVIVKYLAKKPGVSVIQGAEPNDMFWEFIIFPLIPLIFGLILSYIGIFKGQRNLYMIKYGEIADGKIIKSHRISENRIGYDVEFKTKDGETCKAYVKSKNENSAVDDDTKLLYCPNETSKIVFISDFPYYAKKYLKGNYS